MGLASELILIVGGTGFLGQHLIQDLVERAVGPERIHILDIKFSGSLTPA
jgi:nucleoside-diphosphate-sugar epimerase